MLVGTMDVLDKAMRLQNDHGVAREAALTEAYSDEVGFGSTDSLSYDILCELYLIGVLLNHKIHR